MLRNLKLTRPLAVIDTETTGLLEHDPRVVEIAVLLVEPDLSMDALVRRIYPGIPIPEQATRIHGITDAAVAQCPTFDQIAESILAHVDGSDLCGFNVVRYDLPVLFGEFTRTGFPPIETTGRLVLDVMQLFHSTLRLNGYGLPERGTGTLAAASHRYLRSAGAATHGALCDVLATLRVLDQMVGEYDALPKDFAALAARDWRPELMPQRAIQSRLLEELPADLGGGAYGPQGRRQ